MDLYSTFVQISVGLMLTTRAFSSVYHRKYEDDYGASSEFSSRMFKGNITSSKNHPYFAMILDPKDGTDGVYYTICGAAFIHPNVLLTAARCFYNTKTGLRLRHGKMKIKYGSDSAHPTKARPEDSGFYLDILKVFFHYDYKATPGEPVNREDFGNRSADFALVQVKPPDEINYQWLLLPDPREDWDFINRKWATLVAAGGTQIDDDLSFDNRGFVMKQSQVRLFTENCPWLDEGYDKYYQVCANGTEGDYRACPGELTS